VFGILGLGGVGAYLYLKNKKASSSSTPTSGSNSTSTTGSTSTSTTGSTSVVDSSLGLLPTAKGLIDETKTNDYIIAKNISQEVKVLQDEINKLESEYTKWAKEYKDKYQNEWGVSQKISKTRWDTVTLPTSALKRKMEQKSKEANALGYKILPYGLIEKM
jgi:hypothetical protein